MRAGLPGGAERRASDVLRPTADAMLVKGVGPVDAWSLEVKRCEFVHRSGWEVRGSERGLVTSAAFKAVRSGGRAIGGWVRFPHASAILPSCRERPRATALIRSVDSQPDGSEIEEVSALAPISRLRPGIQALYAAVLIAAVITSGLLRSFHDQTPRLFPGAFGSLLALGTFALLALHLLERREGRDLLGEAANPAGLRVEVAIPLLTVVLAEKWVSVDLLASAWQWIDHSLSDPRLADAVYRGWTALALLGVALASVWVLRQSRHRLLRTLEVPRFSRALLLTGAGFAITSAVAWTLVIATGAWSAPYRGLPPSLLMAVAASQTVRGAAEELFYRGVIQTGLVRLLAETGLGEGRTPRLLAIVTVSTGFAVEHYDPGMTPAANLRPLLFVLVLSATLGTLLEVSRNLYLVMALHVQINLLVAGLWPLPLGPEGQTLLPPGTLVALLLVVVFVGVVIRHRRRGFA